MFFFQEGFYGDIFPVPHHQTLPNSLPMPITTFHLETVGISQEMHKFSLFQGLMDIQLEVMNGNGAPEVKNIYSAKFTTERSIEPDQEEITLPYNDHSGNVTDKTLSKLSNKVSADKLDVIAIEWFDITLPELDNLKRACRDNIWLYNMKIFQNWVQKNPGPQQRQV